MRGRRGGVGGTASAFPVGLGVDRVPEWRSNEEVLRAHRLDDESTAERVAADLPTRVALG